MLRRGGGWWSLMKIREYKNTIHYKFDNSKKDQEVAWIILEEMNPLRDFEKPPETPPEPEGREG